MISYLRNLQHLYSFTVAQGPIVSFLVICLVPFHAYALYKGSYVSADYNPIQEGSFRFDELLVHLKAFSCPNIVSVAEDATRVIRKVQYDAETNKLVGFVLPCDEDGLPLCDSFMATTFESMQKYFSEESIANYAFVYMVQPLTENVPAFCLSCVGTDNKFNAELVLKRWQYIYSELQKRNVHLMIELCSRWRLTRIESYASFYSTFIIILLDIIFRIIFFTVALL